jgi:hypothetical protein
MRKITIVVILLLLATVVGVGCVSPTPVPAATSNEKTYDYNLIKCPNPDCPLHSGNPHAIVNGYNILTIKMAYIPQSMSMAQFYCEYCGACWRQTV